jgi:hypothetical protein
VRGGHIPRRPDKPLAGQIRRRRTTKMLNKDINWKKEEESINKSLMYGKTIDELFDELIDEMPWT